MPNWCSNTLYIEGEEADVETVLQHIGARREKPEFDFNTVIPYPQAFQEQDDDAHKMRNGEMTQEAFTAKYGNTHDGYNNGGYEWCIGHWGTKWNVLDEVEVSGSPTGAKLTFDTAWSPPEQVVKALAARFPACVFCLQYEEEGAGFRGTKEFHGDELMIESDEDY